MINLTGAESLKTFRSFFAYDANGNMKTNEREGLDYGYNFLNLTAEARDLSDNVLAQYRWLADGTKAGVRDTAAGANGYEYLGSLVYKRLNGQLQLESAAFGGGRIEVSQGSSGASYTPNYYLTDHLGSTRVIWNGSTAIRSDFTPFGTRWTNGAAAASRYQFTGYEDQPLLDDKYMDAGARFYNHMTFNTIDPLAEARPRESPYAYTGNNPINRIDPTGLYYYDYGMSVYRTDAGEIVSWEEVLWNNFIEPAEGNEGGPEEHADWEYNIPLWGTSILADEAWAAGNYYDWVGWILLGMAEGVSFGLAVLETQAVKTAAIGAMRVGATRAGTQTLKSVGLGSTGRTTAKNLTEHLAMQEIMANPKIGEAILRMGPLSDLRWAGWSKMQYIHEASNGQKVIIHYVGKWENGILTHVDDFKFVTP
ncbi:MAG: hypothetical protein LBR57_03965 [Alistipes sp.]|nr:hypothetical protein [Alistipes sp.]